MAFCALTLWSPVALAQQVIDGETLRIAGVQYQLCGIDAPERKRPGSHEATVYLRTFIAGKQIHCVPVGQGTPCDDRSKPTNDGRIVAQCFADKVDLAAEMVRSGHAKDWPKFSGGYYSR